MKNETVKLPLWKNCLDNMREEQFSYGKTWEAEYFEKALRQPRASKQFAFEMLSLKQEIEREDGMYLKSEENGARYSIIAANAHEDVAARFDRKVRSFAVRSINLRSATLLNPDAKLTDDERRRMEHNLERASLRLVLLSRSESAAKVLREHAPAILDKKKVE